MAEKNPQPNKIPSDYISDSKTLEEEVDECLHTSVEEWHYNTIRGSAQAPQAAYSYTTA